MRSRVLRVRLTLATLAAILLGCSGGESVPSEPSGAPRPPRPSRVTPINPGVQPATRGNLQPNFVFIVFPGDTTTDPCFGREYCAVQGRAAGGQAVIFCPNGPGTCPDHRYRWSIENPPPNTTTTFDPEVTVNEQVTTFFIQTDSTTLPGSYEPVIVSTLDDIVTAATTSTPYTGGAARPRRGMPMIVTRTVLHAPFRQPTDLLSIPTKARTCAHHRPSGSREYSERRPVGAHRLVVRRELRADYARDSDDRILARGL
jgi:hypothetical protein